ncbi:MAG: hypothetical protein AXW14_14195 [Alteromonas sp. Nap_26]|nr:MAG: hypothetical protein AXW14_14195 [Alteromonas sp. Nap_26]
MYLLKKYRIKNTFFNSFFAFFTAWLTSFTLASVFHSSFVLYELHNIDVEISVPEGASMMIGDLFGLLPTYGAVIAIALLLAFLITHWALPVIKNKQRLQTSTPHSPTIYLFMFGVAGTLAFWVMLSAMQPILNVTLIAGARTALGTTAQCLAGLIGGLLYGKLRFNSRI